MQASPPIEPSSAQENEPSLWKWVAKVASSVGLAGMLCCVAPAVLFMLGIMGGAYAISFANFFYEEDGSAGIGAWVLRGVAVIIGIGGFVLFKRKQNQCSIDPKRKRKNLILIFVMIAVFGVGIFLTLEKLSGWYFDKVIVPAKEAELNAQAPQ
ncbi:MAG: hypothetical protein IH984_07375 [Planctomycetes bacterium]|nr:hypothetical protein [Planctomycetota bacterium]